MRIYTDEFMKAMEKIEVDVCEAVYKWGIEIGRDSMIESRVISIGDTNEFGDGFFVSLKTHKLDIEDEIHHLTRKKTVEDVSKLICRNAINYLQDLVEKRIEESETPITRPKDVRKIIKVVVDGDAIVNHREFDLYLKIGIEEYNKRK